MIVFELWDVFRRFHRRKLIYNRNKHLYGVNYRYVIVNINKRTGLRCFCTLKEARAYLLEIQSFYERKNRVVYVNKYSRSIVVSSVAQHIFYVVIHIHPIRFCFCLLDNLSCLIFHILRFLK